MRTSIIYYFIILFSWSLNALAIESSKLIKLEDIEYIFETNIQKWNQNVVFFEKKKTMEKITRKDSNVYSLKSSFNNGYIILTPIFKSSEVYMLNLDYNLPELHLNKINIQKHFDQMKPKICNIIELEGKNSVTIQLTKC
tara:strand:- start:768 stop:1187 length:420 start_codon:yes stop_codon:yes gene_type:complete